MPKVFGDKYFSYIFWGTNLYDGSQNYMGQVIFITTISLFHFFRNSQHPETGVSFKNFFRKCECIRSCYLSVSSILPKKTFENIQFLCFLSFYQQFNLKFVSPIFYQIFIFHQMIAFKNYEKCFFISFEKLFSFSRYSNFCIFVFPSFSARQPLL